MTLVSRSLLVLALLVIARGALASSPGDVAQDLMRAQRALDDWRLDDAARIAEDLNARLPDVPPVQAVVGAVKFHQGDYEGAARLLRRAAEGGVSSPLLPLAESTLEETRGFVAKESAHFIVRTPPGKDELLADIALWALEEAYANISEAFDYQPAHKIPVDILHDAKGLASVSTLTVKEIETSGTIALCKFNRLMITSPKALARGYSWLDTLAHEFVHLVVSEKSANTVPIWLHEGLAKYSESLWRGEPGLALDPASENLLAGAVKKNRLITFEQMHPSMAKLPSQEDTALAFAEVFTVIEYLHKEKGKGKAKPYGATNKLLEGLRDGKDMDAALKGALGTDLKGLQRGWTRYLKQRPFKLHPGAQPKKLTFVKNARTSGGDADDEEADAALDEAKGRDGRRYVRLGNLLRERGRVRAAALEYEKASAKVGHLSPALHNRLAGLYVELGDDAKALRILDKTLSAFPDDPQSHVLLGRVALRQERWADAKKHYERATWENPFNPEIHMALYRIGAATKDDALKKRAERNIRLLSGHAKEHAAADAPWSLGPKDAYGTVSVSSAPWGEVFVDGRATSITTPLVDFKLKPGKHRIRVEDRLSGRIASVEVEIKEGQPARVDVELKSVSPEERERLYALEQKLAPVKVEREDPVELEEAPVPLEEAEELDFE